MLLSKLNNFMSSKLGYKIYLMINFDHIKIIFSIIIIIILNVIYLFILFIPL